MFRRIKEFFIRDWVLVEAHTNVWNVTHGAGEGLSQSFILYKIEYSPYRELYRLKCEGKNPEQH